MSAAARAAAGVVVAVGCLGALAWLSQLAYSASPGGESELRLAWRARVPRVEACRRLSAEEQAELPIHMRREEVCEGRTASYRLEVTVDGRRVRASTVEGAGARGDRPLYVFESIPLESGRHALVVSFTRVGANGADGDRDADGDGDADADGDGDGDSRGDEGPGGGASGDSMPTASTVPDRLVLRESLTLEPREVVLVTYDPARRRLELRRAASSD